MTVVWQSLVKLGVTIYLLFGGYTLFCGFIEKNRKKSLSQPKMRSKRAFPSDKNSEISVYSAV